MIYVQTELIKGNHQTVAWIPKRPYVKEGSDVVLEDETTWTIKKMYEEINTANLTPRKFILH